MLFVCLFFLPVSCIFLWQRIQVQQDLFFIYVSLYHTLSDLFFSLVPKTIKKQLILQSEFEPPIFRSCCFGKLQLNVGHENLENDANPQKC